MTSRERVLLVLKHRFADQVPVAEMWIDPGVARAVMPGARDGNDAAVLLDMDMVTAPTMIYGPDEIAWEDRAAARPTWWRRQNGSWRRFLPPARTSCPPATRSPPR